MFKIYYIYWLIVMFDIEIKFKFSTVRIHVIKFN